MEKGRKSERISKEEVNYYNYFNKRYDIVPNNPIHATSVLFNKINNDFKYVSDTFSEEFLRRYLKDIYYEITHTVDVSLEYVKNYYYSNEIEIKESSIKSLKLFGKKLKLKQREFTATLSKLGEDMGLEDEVNLNEFHGWFDDKFDYKKLKVADRKAFEKVQEIKEYINLISNPEITYYPYCEVGALFAQGFIKKEVIKYGYVFFYKDKKFDRVGELSNYIKKNVLKLEYCVRQYISATLNEKGQKNFYDSKKNMSEIMCFCKEKKYVVTSDFQKKYDDLNDLHK